MKQEKIKDNADASYELDQAIGSLEVLRNAGDTEVPESPLLFKSRLILDATIDKLQQIKKYIESAKIFSSNITYA